MPGNTDFRYLHQSDFGVSMEAPDGPHFIVHPFATGPTLYLRADVEREAVLSDIDLQPGACNNKVHASTETEYLHLVTGAIMHCRGLQGKVVLSRVREMTLGNIQWRDWLNGLRNAFPQAFVYLLHTQHYGTWMGATPETLVQSQGRQFQTDALAGTKWGDEAFTQKEFEEQEVVTRTIADHLRDVKPAVSERWEVKYGNSLRHLLTRISWESDRPIQTFAQQLHPTPAVCGVPTADAREYILTHEPYDRILYTGFLGKADLNENSHLFVNLRCMQLFRDRIRIFAGGGINALSDPFTEWEETERKMNALLRAMNINGGNI